MITSAELLELEEKAIEQGLAAEELMENAGRQVFLAIRKRFDLEGKHIFVFCGTGNNGGDGRSWRGGGIFNKNFGWIADGQ